MEDLHIIIKEIKQGYRQLGIVYSKKDIIHVLVSYYGLKPYQIEDLKL